MEVKSEKKIRMNIQLSPFLKNAVKKVAQRLDVSQSEYIATATEERLDADDRGVVSEYKLILKRFKELLPELFLCSSMNENRKSKLTTFLRCREDFLTQLKLKKRG